MSKHIEEQIRRYARALDEQAPPVEELLPTGLAEDLGLDPTGVRVTARLEPAPPPRRTPGWAIALAVVAAVLVLSVPLILLLTDDGTDVVTTPSTVPATTPSTVPATTIVPGPAEPSLTFDRSTGQLSGTSWEPGATVTATLGAEQRTARADSEGAFAMPATDFVKCCFEELEVTDGAKTIVIEEVPDAEIRRVDPEHDVIAGIAWSGPEVHLTILGGPEPFETVVESRDNAWFVDLTGQFDLQPGMVVELSVEYPDITVTHSSGETVAPGLNLRLGGNELGGGALAPVTPVSISIDGVALTEPITTDAGGGFNVALSQYGLALFPGAEVTVSDGISTIEAVVPVLTYEVFDRQAGLASGTTDLAEGTEMYLEVWMSSDGSSSPNQYATYNMLVENGSWSVRLDPIPGDWTVLETDVGAVLPAGYTVEMLIQPN